MHACLSTKSRPNASVGNEGGPFPESFNCGVMANMALIGHERFVQGEIEQANASLPYPQGDLRGASSAGQALCCMLAPRPGSETHIHAEPTQNPACPCAIFPSNAAIAGIFLLLRLL